MIVIRVGVGIRLKLDELKKRGIMMIFNIELDELKNEGIMMIFNMELDECIEGCFNEEYLFES